DASLLKHRGNVVRITPNVRRVAGDVRDGEEFDELTNDRAFIRCPVGIHLAAEFGQVLGASRRLENRSEKYSHYPGQESLPAHRKAGHELLELPAGLRLDQKLPATHDLLVVHPDVELTANDVDMG